METEILMDTKEEKEKQYQVTVTQKDIRDIKSEVAILSNKVNDVHTAIIGSPLAKDGGMVQRLLDCENELKMLRDRVDEVDLKAKQREFYVRWIWGLAAFIIGTIFVELIKYLSPIYKHP